MPSSSLDQRGLRTYLLAYGRLVERVCSHSSLLCMCEALSLEKLRPLTRAGNDVGCSSMESSVASGEATYINNDNLVVTSPSNRA